MTGFDEKPEEPGHDPPGGFAKEKALALQVGQGGPVPLQLSSLRRNLSDLVSRPRLLLTGRPVHQWQQRLRS